ncbi:Uncharacterized protein TCM_010485 [Theobroma cacao]|uniref:Uncharacterized protein n=1 Tax=Theobroma cacao TaxID=3641 RepID=A0A061E6L4_THECC|nr:Uncharacterized protein TCM_010485 [Theobroma cacao]
MKSIQTLHRILIQVSPHVFCPLFFFLSYHQSITKNLPTIIRVRGGWGVMYVGQWKTKLKSKDGMMAESQKRQWVFGLSVL